MFKGKKKSIKIVALVMSMLLVCGLFTGCNKKATDKDEEGRTVISVGSWPSAEGESLDKMNDRKDRFEKANEDVVIVPDTWAFERQTFYSKAAGGQLPTVYMAGFTEVPEIITSEYSADLTKVLKKRGYDGKFNDGIMDVVSDNGKIMAFPTMAYILGLAYNVEMFEKAGLMEEDGTPKQPKDWDEVVEFAVKIKEATGKPGIVLPTAGNSGGWIFTSIAWSFGVDFMEKDADGKWKATFDTKEAAEALQFIKDLKWKHNVLPANTLINGEEWYKQFATGNGAMTITAGDYPRRVVKYGMTADKVGMLATPAGPKRHVTLLGGEVLCVKADATEDQIDAAIRWIETAYNYSLTDEYKKNAEASIESQLNEGRHVGIKSMSPWNVDTEALKWYHKYIDSKANANINHVKLYNDFVANCPADIQPEEPVCAQELYAILDACIQEVLTNKNADCAKVMKKANADFQANYLDNLVY
ncbi:MAG: extracellular solute-binding protein [Clostridia bacterium]|nr:extracellular solute-binding protein [Clostridia bacterium]